MIGDGDPVRISAEIAQDLGRTTESRLGVDHPVLTVELSQMPAINLASVKTIYPVLVFLDRSFTSPYLHELYNEHFDRDTLRRPTKRVITPLSALTIDDLENSLPYTNEHSMTEILDSYWQRNRNAPPHQRQFRVPILDGKKPGKDVARERLKRFGDDFQRVKDI
jgi:hypothetical protein